MSPITFQLKTIVERNKCSCKIFFAIKKCFLSTTNEKNQQVQVKNEMLVEKVSQVLMPQQ
jgi:hypothetical protein